MMTLDKTRIKVRLLDDTEAGVCS